jgi:GntR family transcriptional regulator, transcriptional repressor for pyruvate dehydrogenase complex
VGVGQAERLPAYQQLAEDLRIQITTGMLRPGERLPTEPQLCASWGLSRSTVREALRLLASQHLIVTTRGVTGGSFVAHPSPEQLGEILSTGMRLLLSTGVIRPIQLIEVREMLEAPAAALAATRRSDSHLAALRAALFDPSRDPRERLLQAYRDFHAALAVAAGNPLCELVTTPLYWVGYAGDRMPADFWQRIDADHRRIERAVTVRDSEAAREATLAHLAHLRTVNR